MSLSSTTHELIRHAAVARGIDQSAVVEDAVRRAFQEERRIVAQAALLADGAVDEAIAEAWGTADAPLPEDRW